MRSRESICQIRHAEFGITPSAAASRRLRLCPVGSAVGGEHFGLRAGQAVKSCVRATVLVADQRENRFGRIAADHPDAVELEQREAAEVRRQRAADRDLHAVMLGQPLEPRGEVHRVADQRIGLAAGAEPILPTQHGPALRPMPILTSPGHACSAAPGISRLSSASPAIIASAARAALRILVGIVERRIPEGQDRIADVLVDRRLAFEQDVAHRRQEADQEPDDLAAGRSFSEMREKPRISQNSTVISRSSPPSSSLPGSAAIRRTSSGER